MVLHRNGTFTRGNVLSINGAASGVSRQGNGIRTVRTDNGERIDYTRSSYNGGYTQYPNNQYPNNQYPNNGYPNNQYPNNGYPNYGGNNDINLNDLVTQNSSYAESQMQTRGFRRVDRFDSNGIPYEIWFNSGNRQCIQVGLADGKYLSINQLQYHAKCR